jgi:hypothetical protein
MSALACTRQLKADRFRAGMLNANLWLVTTAESCLFFSGHVGGRRTHPQISSSYGAEFSNDKVLPCFLHSRANPRAARSS